MTDREAIYDAAALAAAGAAPPVEGDEAFAHYAPVAAALFAATPPIMPPTALRDRILRRVDPSPVELFVQRDTDTEWRDLGPPGIRVRSLYRDVERGVQTLLLSIPPGGCLPAHPHRDAEECFVVSGDLETFGAMFKAGDYVRAPAGLAHTASYSVHGCTLLLTAGIDAEKPK